MSIDLLRNLSCEQRDGIIKFSFNINNAPITKISNGIEITHIYLYSIPPEFCFTEEGEVLNINDASQFAQENNIKIIKSHTLNNLSIKNYSVNETEMFIDKETEFKRKLVFLPGNLKKIIVYLNYDKVFNNTFDVSNRITLEYTTTVIGRNMKIRTNRRQYIPCKISIGKEINCPLQYELSLSGEVIGSYALTQDDSVILVEKGTKIELKSTENHINIVFKKNLWNTFIDRIKGLQ